MQRRISEGPHSALGLPDTASAEEVRTAFLELTKQFHPARFGRLSHDIQRLANEVFLGIKLAHDALMKALGVTPRGAPNIRQSGAFPPVNPDTLGGRTPGPQRIQPQASAQARTTGQVPLVGRPTPMPSSFAQGTARTGPIPRPSTPVGAPAPAQGGSPQTPAVPRTLTPTGNIPTSRPGTPPGAPGAPGNGSRQSPAGGLPPVRPTPPLGIPIQRSSTPAPRPSTPPQQPPRPTNELDPGTIRYNGVQPARSTGQIAFDEKSALEHALGLLTARDWPNARIALHALAARVPQSKPYRALLCYARGREAQATGRPDEALLEFQRALQLDPDLSLAKQAIAELQRRR